MALTITIPGAVEATIGATAPAVLTIGVGTPGATGPAGPAGAAGVGVPVGGTAGQFLTKIDGTNYNTDWTTVNLSAYAVKANNLSDLASASTARTNLGLGTMATATASDYSTTAAANLLYAPIAAGQPTSGTVGQVLTKNSGTNYDSSWATLIPGDRYLTSSTTSLTINNANKTLTVGTGLSYTPEQDVIIAYDAAHHMHARVTTYNSGTGVMEVNVISHTGTGTFAVWTVNVGGTVPVASIVWGDITGTLGNQTDLANALNDKLELSGGVLDANATIEASTATQLAVFGGSGLNVELSANPSENSVLNYGGLQVQNFSGTMAVTPSGLTFPNSSTQTVAFPGFAGYAALAGATFTGEVSTPASTTSSAGLSILPGTAPTSPVNGEIWNTGSDLQVQLGGVTETIAEQSWISTNYAPKADSALTGNVTITTNSANAALVITQDGAGDVVQFKDVTSDTTYSFISSVGKVNTIASVTTGAGFNIPNGVAPTSNLVNGDLWTTTGGVFARINGNSVQLADTASGLTYSGNNTFSGPTLIFGNTTAASTIGIGTGATVSGSTRTISIGTGSAAGSTNAINIGGGSGTVTTTLNGTTNFTGPITGAINNITLGNGTAASTYNLFTGATVSGSTKAVAIASGGAAGSTTTVTIGNTTGSTTTLQGNVTASGTNLDLGNASGTANYTIGGGTTTTGQTKTIGIGTNGSTGSTTSITIGSSVAGVSTTNVYGSIALLSGGTSVTATADTNSTAIATTAYVVGQAGSATPIVDGTAAVGTSLRYARQDHVHPTDTSRAPLASPSLTGTPLSTTAAVDTNTTQIATTAYVVGQGYAKLASPTFTGTPTLPTGTIATTQTAGNNTTAVATTAFVTAAVPAFATTAQVVAATSTSTSLAPGNQGFLLTNPRLQSLAFINATALSGSGSATSSQPQTFSRQVYLNSLAVGRASFNFGSLGSATAGFGTSTAKADQVDFSKKVWIAGYACMGFGGGTSYLGDANTICRISLGGYSTSTTGDMTLKGIGLKKVGGASSFVTLTVHNGTTLTDVASTVTVPDGGGIHWQIYSDGTGNVTLYINGTQAATTTAGPTTATASGQACYREQVEAVATPGVRQAMNCNGGWFYTE